MPNELRVRQNFVGGIIEDNPLTAAATTLTSAALAVVPVIGTTQHYPITLDPDGIGGEPEIVWVTAHVANATTATVVRAQEGTTAREHRRDLNWVHGPTERDIRLAPSYWGVPGVIVGVGAGAADHGPLIQAGSNVGTPSSGVLPVTFHSPFPKGVSSVVATAGDKAPANVAAVVVHDITLTGFNVTVYNTSGSPVGTVCRINWFVMGH